MEFFQNFRLDRNSFWIGFFAASLFWWLVRISRPLIHRLRQSFRSQAESAEWDTQTITSIRLRNETLRYAQSMHLAAPLFSLDEITIPPRLLASGLPHGSLDHLANLEIAVSIIPDTPDWPQIASYYHAPALSLAEALSAGANLAIIAQPGAGKSVALAQFASQLSRNEIEINGIAAPVPLFIHAADLILPAVSPDILLSPLTSALANYISQQTFAKLPPFVEHVLQEGLAIVILDGLDEMHPSGFDLIVDYLEQLLNQFPKMRIVTAASSDYWGRLPQIGFHILPLAYWTSHQRAQLLEKWGNLWQENFSSPEGSTALPDPDLIKGWLVTDEAYLTPLELVCKTWAAFAGDATGPTALDAMQAYLRRRLHTLSEKQSKALEIIAAQMLLSQQPVAEKAVMERWLSGQDEFRTLLDDQSQENLTSDPQVKTSAIKVKASSALSGYIECGILRSHAGERYAISHPVWTGVLAARNIDPQTILQASNTLKVWDATNLALQFRARSNGKNEWIASMLKQDEETEFPRMLLQASRWLPYAPQDAHWAHAILRRLANELHNPDWTIQIKARLLAALIGSGNNGVTVLLRQLLRTPEADTRRLAILGSGMVRDPKAVEDLSKLLRDDEDAQIASAGILSLVAIGNKPALEAVAKVLLEGNEHLRRTAAEAFANHVEEGHPTLQDASEMEDPGIRKAAVYGLACIKKPWADQILENLRTEDTQWMVQDVANQVLELRGFANPHIPTRLPPLNQTPWLIDFAASHGLGVAPGRPAVDLLFKALEEGDPKQKLFALHTLRVQDFDPRMSTIAKNFQSQDLEIRQAAVETYWHWLACGFDIPI
ncbi:MAG TPA: HEAT repeat domain-containing protein [Anaerolineales bacterium]|nr:HEAT repeat domain-containing protein [Anaerolineales bacterium]